MTKGGKKQNLGGTAGTPWPALAVETRKLRDLKLREENPRSHSLEQIEQIAQSMDEFGWTIPVLIDEVDVILAGHGRVRAARLKGWEDCPVVVARGWSEEQKRAYVIADNQIAANSGWDRKRLQSEMRGLMAAEFDVNLIGFSEDELGKLMLDPKAPAPAIGPTEVVMNKCPTCGRLSRKLENET